MLNYSFKHVSRWCITGSPEQMLIRVFDCRGRNGGSTGLLWAESAGRWRRVQGVDGLYCRGDSELNPGWVEPWGRGSWAWSLGCSGGGGGGGRRQVQRRKPRAAYCPSPQAGTCACAGEPAAPPTWWNVCRRAPRLTPSYRRGAGGRWGAWSHRCRGGVRGRRTRWSSGGGSGAGGRGTPVGSLIWGWRRGRGCRSCSCFRRDGIHSGSSDSRGPCTNPAWRREGRHPWEGWSSGACQELPSLQCWGST